ncbi:MAG: hypothetical protein WAM78_09615 [Candidatus Sulfotelmatobacter sp.]
MKIRLGKLLPVLGALVWASGCASIGAPLPPSLELPKPPTDLHAVRKGDRVTLTWTIPARTTDRQSVRYLGKTRICRSVGAGFTSAEPTSAASTSSTAPASARTSDAGGPKECGTPVGDVAPPANFTAARKSSAKKLIATFTDVLSPAIQQANVAGFATYGVEVQNVAGRGAGISNQVRVPLVPTLPPFDHFAAQPVSQGIFISWHCAAAPGTKENGVRYSFRIYRRLEGSDTETKIGELGALCINGPSASDAFVDLPPEKQNDFMASFLDQTFEWEKTYFYHGAVVSVVELPGKPAVEVEGDDTPEVKVFAHDVFPPAVPSGLQAVFSGPGQQPFIDLIWAPVTDADLDGYNVYRHEDGAAAVKLNSELVKAPAFRDTQVEAGKKYFYSVSAVDQRGNESARSEEASESVP